MKKLLVSFLLFASLSLGGCAASNCRESAIHNLQKKADVSPASKLGGVTFKVLDCVSVKGLKQYVCSVHAVDSDGEEAVIVGTEPAPTGCTVK